MEEQHRGRFKTSIVHENDAFVIDATDPIGADIDTQDGIRDLDPIVAFKEERNRKKHLIHLQKDVLPRLENYRMSIRTARPTLGELLGTAENAQDNQNNPQESQNEATSGHGVKLGWIQGVLIPCMLNIFGVMLFLRLSWVVGEAGTGLSLVIIGISAAVCVVTTLSLSAICTNGEVKGGGIYYIISRSLGPEFGASVGVVFAFANAVSASMNTIGFCNSLSDLLNKYDLKIIDGDINDARIVGTVTIILLICVCGIGMEWESKAQNFLIAIIGGAMIDYMVGAIMGPMTDEQRSDGFVGFNDTVWNTNWYPEFRKSEGTEYNFFQVFAIFFPSVTGIQAGANISGDLKDPASAIPKGTLLSLLITMTSYALFVCFVGATAIRDASGVIGDLSVGNLSSCAADQSCKYGILNNYQMMGIMSAWWPFIFAGSFAACLSTALTNLFSVPRLIQALGVDKIFPGLMFFSKGYGKSGEPYRGYILTFIVAEVFLLIGDLNAIAPLISNFYLASYALINFCTFHAALIRPLGWRPTFTFYNTWLSLLGFFGCVVVMFLINWITALVTFVVILGLYLVVAYRKPDANWGSSTQAQTYKTALAALQRLNKVGEHVKNYTPQILLLCGQPNFRPSLLDFANLITKNNSLLVVGDIIEDRISLKERSRRFDDAYTFFKDSKVKAFYAAIDNVDYTTGTSCLMQSVGIGRLAPNILMIGYKNDWPTCSKSKLNAYFDTLHAAFDHNLSVAMLRIKGGLDYSSIQEITEVNALDNSLTVNTHTIPLGNSSILHMDTNVALANIGVDVGHVEGSNTNHINQIGSNRNSNEDTVTRIREMRKRKRKITRVNVDAVLNMSNEELLHLEDMNRFREKQGKGSIDIWWLYDSGGLTVLLPYIISMRSNWSESKLRIFGLSSNKNDLEMEEKNMAQLLNKFRIQYSFLKMFTAGDEPQESTKQLFNSFIDKFTGRNYTKDADPELSESELNTNQERTRRHLCLRELLLKHSTKANLIAMSLPMPRKKVVSAPLYMAWLEILTKDMPPFLLVRGNQQSVLTFYS